MFKTYSFVVTFALCVLAYVGWSWDVSFLRDHVLLEHDYACVITESVWCPVKAHMITKIQSRWLAAHNELNMKLTQRNGAARTELWFCSNRKEPVYGIETKKDFLFVSLCVSRSRTASVTQPVKLCETEPRPRKCFLSLKHRLSNNLFRVCTVYFMRFNT